MIFIVLSWVCGSKRPRGQAMDARHWAVSWETARQLLVVHELLNQQSTAQHYSNVLRWPWVNYAATETAASTLT